MEEFLDVVDDDDEVIGKAAYSEIYKKRLAHRIVHILIFNKKKEMLLQLRSREKRFCPLHWSTSVGGHVSSGESYEDAALRECNEELGIDAEIKFLRKDLYIHKTPDVDLKKFLCTFTAISEGPFRIKHDEVEKVEFASIEKIQDMINSGEKFHPELLFILERQYHLRH